MLTLTILINIPHVLQIVFVEYLLKKQHDFLTIENSLLLLQLYEIKLLDVNKIMLQKLNL